MGKLGNDPDGTLDIRKLLMYKKSYFHGIVNDFVFVFNITQKQSTDFYDFFHVGMVGPNVGVILFWEGYRSYTRCKNILN